MRKVLLLGHLLAMLSGSAFPEGIYTEYKCTLLNGDRGKHYTFDGKTFIPSLKYDFGSNNGHLKISDGTTESDNIYNVINKMLIVKKLVRFKSSVDTIIYKFEIEEKKDELILTEYRDGFNKDYYLKKHYFKKGNHELPINDKGDLEIYNTVEEMPEFPGGILEMNKFITKGQDAAERMERGSGVEKVFVKLLIAPSGKIVDGRILVFPKLRFAKAAMQIVRKLPDFSPGKHNGKAVYVYYNLPVTFRN